MSDGGITVTKISSGAPLLLEDIHLYIHYGSNTYISANDYVNSVDLHRAINSKAVMILVDATSQGAPKPIFHKQPSLVEENQKLQEEVRQSSQQNISLQEDMKVLQGQMAILIAAVGNIKSVAMPTQGPAQRAVVDDSDAIPVFIPEDLVSKDAEVRISLQRETSKDDHISGSVNRLRELRKASK